MSLFFITISTAWLEEKERDEEETISAVSSAIKKSSRFKWINWCERVCVCDCDVGKVAAAKHEHAI